MTASRHAVCGWLRSRVPPSFFGGAYAQASLDFGANMALSGVRSSAVEHSAHNRPRAGSNPAGPTIFHSTFELTRILAGKVRRPWK